MDILASSLHQSACQGSRVYGGFIRLVATETDPGIMGWKTKGIGIYIQEPLVIMLWG